MKEIAQALFNRLSVAMSPVPVFDFVKQDHKSYPYIQINQLSPLVDDSDTENGFNTTVRIVAFSDYRGFAKVYDLADGIYTALHLWEMPQTTSYLIGQIVETGRQYLIAPDGLVRYSVQEFRLFIEKI